MSSLNYLKLNFTLNSNIIFQINAYLICDKLKSAYLLAIKLKSALDVRRVLVAAEQSGQVAIQQICKTWLQRESNTDVKPKQ